MLEYNRVPYELIHFQGMEFIHKSSLKSHGNLRPSVCLVDSRLQVKLSGFGLWEFKYATKTKLIPPDDHKYEGWCRILLIVEL